MSGEKIAPIRAWMQHTRKPFTARDVVKGLGMPPDRISRVRDTVAKMVQRGELIFISRGTYQYNHAWRALPSARRPVVKRRILRAIYYAHGSFRLSYVTRTAESGSMYTHKVLYSLLKAGYSRRIKDGLFVVADRDRYRRECM